MKSLTNRRNITISCGVTPVYLSDINVNPECDVMIFNVCTIILWCSMLHQSQLLCYESLWGSIRELHTCEIIWNMETLLYKLYDIYWLTLWWISKLARLLNYLIHQWTSQRNPVSNLKNNFLNVVVFSYFLL